MSDKSADTPPAISISPFLEEYLKSFTFLGDTNDLERRWTELQPEFDRLGYRFRPRHRPGWTPSWDISDPFSRHEHEDSIPLPEEDVIDAVRVVDNARVCIKMLTADEEGKTEVGIASFLGTSSDGRRTPTVPVLDTVVLPDRPDLLFLVMPELLMWNCVPFEHVDEVLDFVRQMLFGLHYMHFNYVAHGDIGYGNILMDGLHLFDSEPHPADLERRLDLSGYTRIRPRRSVFPSYYFIDFELATYNPPGSRKTFYRGFYGHDTTVPEFRGRQLVDPFRADLWSMGRFLLVFLADAYHGVEMLRPLIAALMQIDPDARLSALNAHLYIERIIAQLSPAELASPVFPVSGYRWTDVVTAEKQKAFGIQ